MKPVSFIIGFGLAMLSAAVVALPSEPPEMNIGHRYDVEAEWPLTESTAPSMEGPMKCVRPGPRVEPKKPGDEVPDQFIVYLKPKVNCAKHLSMVNQLIADATACEKTPSKVAFAEPFCTKLSMYGGTFGPSLIAALKSSPDIESVVADTLAEEDSPTVMIPSHNVTSQRVINSQFQRTQTNGWGLARLNTGVQPVTVFGAEDATRNRGTRNWPYTFRADAGKNVDVYVIDSGVSDHTDLAGRIDRARGQNFALQAPSPSDTVDEFGHGTRMAGIIAGQTCGVAKWATIIPLKVKNPPSGGTPGTISLLAVLAALNHVSGRVGNRPRVVSISLSLPLGNQGNLFVRPIGVLLASGIHVVNSAGNNGQNRCATRIGDAHGTITVGNANFDDQRRPLSNYGPCLTVFAPGTEIPGPDYANPNGFNSNSGTSEATAHTSGVVATLLSRPGPVPAPADMKAAVLALSVQVPTIVSPDPTTNLLIQAPPENPFQSSFFFSVWNFFIASFGLSV
ncbi:peptidase S8/S53 domain-containing protein [Mycena crocata]|nr:peptidase S8/S53 domain-containing protein [Mycena crocata]